MNTLLNQVERVEKEVITTLSFPTKEVLTNPVQHAERKQKLKRAAQLGNLEKHKVAIDFVDEVGPKQVETTIWSITEQYIILKYNMRIPINRITNITLI